MHGGYDNKQDPTLYHTVYISSQGEAGGSQWERGRVPRSGTTPGQHLCHSGESVPRGSDLGGERYIPVDPSLNWTTLGQTGVQNRGGFFVA